jgi:hypothetical protein
MELLAQICIHSEPGAKPPRALKREVKLALCKMFELFLGDKAAYAVERLIVAAKAFDLVRKEGDYLLAIIKPKQQLH